MGWDGAIGFEEACALLAFLALVMLLRRRKHQSVR